MINANLFARVATAQPRDPARYYLGGVHIAAHPTLPGVTLAATDGHMMLVAYDAVGTAPTTDGGVIVNLGKEGLKAAAKGDTIHIDYATGTAKVDAAWISPASTLVDGTFPDWRRILPRPNADGETLTHTAAAFDPNLLQLLGKALSETPKTPGGLRLRGADATTAHLATIANSLPIFGVVMPTRDREGGGDTLPDWIA